MKWLNGYRIRLVLIGFVVGIVLCGGQRAKADFTFGEPTNLGPVVNSQNHDQRPSISDEVLELYFMSNRPGGSGTWDMWVATRETTHDEWGIPVNLGPTVNSSGEDWNPRRSADGLELYFNGQLPGGSGGSDIWVATRETVDAPWNEPVNLGPTVNSSARDGAPSLSQEGLELYFSSDRSGGGNIWVTKRATKQDPWGEPVNLGPTVNGLGPGAPSISSDGLALFFQSSRPGGYGSMDLWMTTRKTGDDAWGEPVNLGPSVNTAYAEDGASISADGRTLYFSDYYGRPPRPGGHGGADLYQVSITPIVDFNGDGIVDATDMCTMVDHWGENYSLCDIGPMPWGDGIVDIQDLIVLAEHLFEEPGLIAHWKLDEVEGIIAADSVSENGYSDGIVIGDPVWQPTGGQVNGAIQLDGVDDYIIASQVLNPADGPFSVLAWIKGGGPGQAVLSQADSVNWLCTDSVEGCLMTELKKDSGRFKGDPLSSEAFINDGNWHRIGFVWDGSCRHLYVDGVEVANDAEPLSGLNDAYGGLYFGVGSTLAQGTYFSGLIDDVRIYNRVVSP